VWEPGQFQQSCLVLCLHSHVHFFLLCKWCPACFARSRITHLPHRYICSPFFQSQTPLYEFCKSQLIIPTAKLIFFHTILSYTKWTMSLSLCLLHHHLHLHLHLYLPPRPKFLHATLFLQHKLLHVLLLYPTSEKQEERSSKRPATQSIGVLGKKMVRNGLVKYVNQTRSQEFG
jgi:hypothetical protein